MHSQQQRHSAEGLPATTSSAVGVEDGGVSRLYGDGNFLAVDLKGRPSDKSKTGRFPAAIFIFGLNMANWGVTASVAINVVFYAIRDLHQDVSTASSISTNFVGTALLLPVLGGFLSDSFMGRYFAIITGSIIGILGLGVLTLSVGYPDLRPPACTATATSTCPPAGGKYTAALYAALYSIAFGLGLLKASLSAFGAEQFDENDPVEQKQSIIYFLWYYFSQMLGGIMAFTLSVWIFNYKSKTWGFGYLLILFTVASAIFAAGTPRYRHKQAGGSFITRIAQVSVAAIRKRNAHLPDHTSQLFDEPIAGGWLERTQGLRCMDKASILDKDQTMNSKSRWALAGVSQVEEAKRIYRVLPVWASTCLISIVFAQVFTFTATQGATLDRRLANNFVLPPQSLGMTVYICSSVMVPVYEKIVLPLCRRVTGLPYGITPLKRIGISAVSATLAMTCAALVEKKRLRYIHRLGYAHLRSFQLPMSMWWLFPQYFLSAFTELFFSVSAYEFYFHEVSDGTRSTAVSFVYSAVSLGYFLSTVLVNTTNRVTRGHDGGSWLKVRLNDGGLRNYFELLAVLLSINFVVFVATSYFYRYNYRLFRTDKPAADHDGNVTGKEVDSPPLSASHGPEGHVGVPNNRDR